MVTTVVTIETIILTEVTILHMVTDQVIAILHITDMVPTMIMVTTIAILNIETLLHLRITTTIITTTAFKIDLIVLCIGMRLINHKTNPTTTNVIITVKIDNLSPFF